MQHLKKLKEYFERIKKAELEDNKVMPPEGLGGLLERADFAYLLYGLRAYCRYLSYGLWAREENIGLREEEFAPLLLMLSRRRDELRKDVLLDAYARTATMFALDVEAETTPLKLIDHFAWLKSNEEKLLENIEDHADLFSFLEAYTRKASNNQKGGVYPRLTLDCVTQVVSGKYGKRWKSRQSRLPHFVLSNIVVNALSLKGEVNWNEIRMDFLPEFPKDTTVYEWVEALLDGYGKRLDKELRKPTLAYCRARVAMVRGDYEEMMLQVLKIGEMPQEFNGLPIRVMNLIAIYEFRFCQPTGAAHPLLRKIDRDHRLVIAKMRAHIKDVYFRQQRLTYQGQHYIYFIDTYSKLMEVRDKASKKNPDSIDRSRYLHEERGKLMPELSKYQFTSGQWLVAKLNELK